MAIVTDILTDDIKALETRAAIIDHGKSGIALLKAWTLKLFRAMVDTIPEEQLKSVLHSMNDMSYVIGVKSPGKLKSDNRNFGMWLSNEQVNALIEGCHDKCMMCNLDKQQRRGCALRKALDSIPNDVPMRDNGDCQYYTEI